MALTSEERVAISKKIVQIPLQNAAANTTASQLDVEKIKAEKEDNSNKKLMDDVTTLINGYQQEISRYDSNGRNELLESDLIDSVDRKAGNFFFPNDTQTPTPSNSDGVWKNYIPFSGSKAIGKTYLETYTTVTKEQDLISTVNSKISAVEALSNIIRSTGQSCGATGTCSLPAYTTEATCTSNSGTWTPGPDAITTDAAMHTAGTELITAIQAWEDFMNGTLTIVVTTDTNTTRSTQNTTSKSNITEATSIIYTWKLLLDYDINHGQTTCIGFNAYNVSLLKPTKFRAAELLAIKNEIVARQSFIMSRAGELNTNLGAVTQNMATGDLVTATGFYGQRMRIINTRLNTMGGSLGKLKGYERGKEAQAQMKSSNDNTALVYSSVMVCSGFRAPATGNSTIHVLSGTGFSNNDTVYISADNQEEIQTKIVSIQSNTITLAAKIPQKYRQNEFARIYKIL